MVKIADILTFLDNEGIAYQFQGRTDAFVEGFSSLSHYATGSIAWVKSEINIPKNINAGLITLAIASKGVDVSAQNIIFTSESKRAFFSVIEKFFGKNEERSDVGYGTYIGPDVQLGVNVKVGHNCTLDGNIIIGDDTIIWDNITITNRVTLGCNCVVQSGTRIGHDDFSYTENKNNVKTMIKHYGGVTIGNDVFIGANCVVYRGTIDDTIIGHGSKIDALCLISHNSYVGENVSIIAGTLLYGSTQIGDNAYIASSIIRNQISIGKSSIVGMGSVVTKDVLPNTTVAGVPAKPLVKEKK